MPRTLTTDEREDFLAQPHVGVLSVASDDDRPPLTVPVWYHYRPGGDITFFTGTQGRKTRKTRLLRKAGKLSFCVQQPTYPYKYVTAESTLIKADRAPSVDDVYAITSRYLPEDVARGFADSEVNNPAGTFILFTVKPDRWLSFDFADDDEPVTHETHS